MIGIKSFFKKLHETQKTKVHLGNKREMQVKCKGIVEVSTNPGKVLSLIHI